MGRGSGHLQHEERDVVLRFLPEEGDDLPVDGIADARGGVLPVLEDEPGQTVDPETLALGVGLVGEPVGEEDEDIAALQFRGVVPVVDVLVDAEDQVGAVDGLHRAVGAGEDRRVVPGVRVA